MSGDKQFRRVFIAAKNMRGTWATPPTPNAVKIDVTSAQAKTYANRLAFSPMSGVPYIDEHEGEFPNFEAYWQSMKLITNVNHGAAKNWWKAITKPKRRHPKMKKNAVLCCVHKRMPGERLQYVDSRKRIYVPDYERMVIDSDRIAQLRELRSTAGPPIVVYDFDGPRAFDGTPICVELNIALLKEKIADISFPFGHGYIVAALISEITHQSYIE